MEGITWVFIEDAPGVPMGVLWAQTPAEAVEMEAYLWFREYQHLDSILDLHQQFLTGAQTEYLVSDSQLETLDLLINAFDKLLHEQILSLVKFDQMMFCTHRLSSITGEEEHEFTNAKLELLKI